MNLEPLPLQARQELLDFYEFLLAKYTVSPPQLAQVGQTQPPLGALATQLFGLEAGVELDLPRPPAHTPWLFEL